MLNNIYGPEAYQRCENTNGLRKLPNGIPIFYSSSLKDHVDKNHYFMEQSRNENVASIDALFDLFHDSEKLSKALMGGLELPSKLYRCEGCGGLFTTEWEKVGDNGKVPNGEIEVDYSWYDRNGEFNYFGSIMVSGSECVPCIRKRKERCEKSLAKARADPKGWMQSLYYKFFPEHIEAIPEDKRESLIGLKGTPAV